MTKTLPAEDACPSYPGTDEIPYLTWFADHFSSVFVALPPFLRSPDHAAYQPDHGTTIEALKHIKGSGHSAGVSWSKVTNAIGFPSIAHVNRALRLTGSKRILPSLANAADTEALLAFCQTEGLRVPDEGCVSPLHELSIADFLEAAGCLSVDAADHFGLSPRTIPSAKFRGPDRVNASEIMAPDRSFFVSIYVDYHYLLICQTAASRNAVDPSTHFEGFFADAETSDLWGIGELPQRA